MEIIVSFFGRTVKKFFFLFLFVCIINTLAYSYDIQIKVNGLNDTSLILAHYLGKSPYSNDTALLDKNGLGLFKKRIKLQQGVYMLYLPSGKFLDIIIGDDQDFSITLDTSLSLSSIKFEGSADNIAFVDYQIYMSEIKKQVELLSEQIKNSKNEKDKEIVRKKIDKLGEDRLNKIIQIQKNFPGSMLALFLNSTVDVKVPDSPKNSKGEIIDSLWQYNYYLNHYFDNFDYSDTRLLYTPLFENKIMEYVTKVIPQMPDSIIKYVDRVIDKARPDSSTYRYVLIKLFNTFAQSKIMGMDALYVHLGEKYYLNDSWWSTEENMNKIKDRVEKTKPLLIGKIAPDIELVRVPKEHFIEAEKDTALKKIPHVGILFQLHQINSKYIALVFWASDCSHCKKSIPKLHELYLSELKNKGVTVIAVSTLFGEEGKLEWVDFVNEHKLYEFINAWNPYSYDFKQKYDILSTPQVFILDKDKKIIAKKIDVEQIGELVDIFDKINASKK